ncbi:hypothetical protein I3V78_29995 [Archangium primigenium]|nr:DUF5953 family protein [Archangium primigenium]MBM7117783.1 hypothetical protein [Archangium primigenium]
MTVFTTPLERGDGRPLAVVQAMEHSFPGLHLVWDVTEDGQLLKLPRREQWFSEAVARGDFPLVCNGDESYPVMVYGIPRDAVSPAGQSALSIHGKLPLESQAIRAAVGTLEGVGEAARGWWGDMSPSAVVLMVAEQVWHPFSAPHTPPLGLPLLKPPDEFDSPLIPYRLGWVNYWSAATAQLLGFPDLSRDGLLLARSRRTASGGWVVPLTEEPLDLDNPRHLDALRLAYVRFPAIRGRSCP